MIEQNSTFWSGINGINTQNDFFFPFFMQWSIRATMGTRCTFKKKKRKADIFKAKCDILFSKNNRPFPFRITFPLIIL